MIDPSTITLTPIDGGFCVKRLDADRCVDVRKMAYNWRLTVTVRPVDEPDHGWCAIDKAWCYYGHGHGHDENNTSRTMATAHLAAVAAALAWDGTGEPAGYQKRAGA